MIDLKTFFRSHFDTKEISDDNMDIFAQDHIERMKANNTGNIYDALITETEAAYNSYYTAKTGESYSEAQKEAGTVTVENLAEEFKSLVSQKEGIIRGTWGTGSAIYQEFYPHGITEYHLATRANLNDLMDRFVMAATAHTAELPAGFVEQFTQLVNDYKEARTAQLNMMGDVSGDKYETAQTRNILEIQLMKNVLFIAINNIGNPDAVEVYYRQHHIRRSTQPTGGEEPETGTDPVTGTVAANTKAEVMEGGFDSNTLFNIKNTGTTPLHFYAAFLPGDPVPADPIQLTAGEQSAVYGSELSVEGNNFLMVFNPDMEEEGSFEVGIAVQ